MLVYKSIKQGWVKPNGASIEVRASILTLPAATSRQNGCNPNKNVDSVHVDPDRTARTIQHNIVYSLKSKKKIC